MKTNRYLHVSGTYMFLFLLIITSSFAYQMSVETVDTRWNPTHSTDDYLTYLNDNGAQCLVVKDGQDYKADLTKKIYDENKNIIAEATKDKIKDDNKVKGYCYTPTTETYLKFGENSTILEYQDIKLIRLEDQQLWINATLNYFLLDTWNNTLNDVWVRYGSKFGGDGPEGLYRYNFVSNGGFLERGDQYYFTWNNKGYKIDYSDICGQENASCEFQHYMIYDDVHNTSYRALNITFYSNGTIDPTYEETVIYSSVYYQNTTFYAYNVSYLQPIWNDTLQAYYTMDHLSGNVLYDISGNNYNAYKHGLPQINTSCVFDSCIQQGTYTAKDGFSRSQFTNMNTDDDFTVSVWVNVRKAGTPNGNIIANGGSGTQMFVLDYFSASGNTMFTAGIYNGTYAQQSTKNVSLNTWYMITAVHHGINNTIDMYLNGYLNESGVSGAGSGTGSNFSIGKASRLGWNFNGSIDQVMVFNTTLSPTDVTALYNNQSQLFKQSGHITTGLINISATNTNRINVTLSDFDASANTSIQTRVAHWNVSRGYNTSSPFYTDSVLFLPFDSDVLDDSIYGNDGILSGSAAYQKGIYNNSLYFNTSSEYVTVANDESLNIESMTFTGWINLYKREHASIQIFLSKGSSTQYDLRIIADGQNNYLGANFVNKSDAKHYISGGYTRNITMNTWHHFAISYDKSGKIVTYLDGIKDSETITTAGGAYDNTSDLLIGKRDATYFFNGKLDNLAIHDRVLNAEEITELYNLGLANWNYTAYQPITENNSFIISNKSTNIVSEYKFISNGFYTPFIWGNITYDTYYQPPNITIDTYPKYGIVSTSPTSPTNFSNTTIYNICTYWSVNNSATLHTVGISWNGTNYTTSGVGNSTYCFQFINLTPYNYSYYHWANNSLGEYNQTANNTYAVGKAEPILTLSFSPDNSVYNGTEVTVWGNNCPIGATCELYVNGSLVSSPYNATYPLGTHNVTYNMTGTLNYTSGSVSGTITVSESLTPGQQTVSTLGTGDLTITIYAILIAAAFLFVIIGFNLENGDLFKVIGFTLFILLGFVLFNHGVYYEAGHIDTVVDAVTTTVPSYALFRHIQMGLFICLAGILGISYTMMERRSHATLED